MIWVLVLVIYSINLGYIFILDKDHLRKSGIDDFLTYYILIYIIFCISFVFTRRQIFKGEENINTKLIII